MGTMKVINLKSEIEQLKRSPGLENITDKEAQQIIDELKRFARLTYQFYREYKEDKEQTNKIAA